MAADGGPFFGLSINNHAYNTMTFPVRKGDDMKSIITGFLCACLISLMFTIPQTAAAADSGGLRYTVSVVKFENRSGWSGQWDLGDAWGIIMTDILNQTGRFIVLGESDMRGAALNEQDLGASGRTVRGNITPPVGTMTPAQILIKGAITHVENHTSDGYGGVSLHGVTLGGSRSKAEVNVTMYMIDSETGQILASTSVVGKSNSSGSLIGYSGAGWSGGLANFKKDNLGKAVEDAVKKGTQWMITQLPAVPWRGTVVLVRDGSIYINRGQREGVTPGQEFIVGQADIIRDPNTGEILEQTLNETARIKVVTVKDKIAICEVVSGDAYSIEPGTSVMRP